MNTTTFYAIRLPNGRLLSDLDYLSELTHRNEWVNSPEEAAETIPVWSLHNDAIHAQKGVRAVLNDLGASPASIECVDVVAVVTRVATELHDVTDDGEIIPLPETSEAVGARPVWAKAEDVPHGVQVMPAVEANGFSWMRAEQPRGWFVQFYNGILDGQTSEESLTTNWPDGFTEVRR